MPSSCIWVTTTRITGRWTDTGQSILHSPIGSFFFHVRFPRRAPSSELTRKKWNHYAVPREDDSFASTSRQAGVFLFFFFFGSRFLCFLFRYACFFLVLEETAYVRSSRPNTSVTRDPGSGNHDRRLAKLALGRGKAVTYGGQCHLFFFFLLFPLLYFIRLLLFRFLCYWHVRGHLALAIWNFEVKSRVCVFCGRCMISTDGDDFMSLKSSVPRQATERIHLGDCF